MSLKSSLHVPDEFLNDIWSVYFHDISNSSWALDSYIRLGNMNTIREFIAYRNGIHPYLTRGMFFVMREHIFPCWDDPYNLNGETISLKILKDQVPDFWRNIWSSMLGETFFEDPIKALEINGISISPKKSFCILKIWMKTPGLIRSLSDAIGLPQHYNGELIYMTNSDNIRNNSK